MYYAMFPLQSACMRCVTSAAEFIAASNIFILKRLPRFSLAFQYVRTVMYDRIKALDYRLTDVHYVRAWQSCYRHGQGE